MDDQRHLVLIGMMGVGKSSVGRRVALRLGRQFLDTDQLVEDEAGAAVAEIFASEGEAAFRAWEAEAVRRALECHPYSVIAFGGGAVLDPTTTVLARRLALVVWLQAPARELARRVAASMRRSEGAPRPLLAQGRPPEVVLDEIARRREDSYQAAAHVLVDTTGRSTGQAATAVLVATGWTVPPAPPRSPSAPPEPPRSPSAPPAPPRSPSAP